MDSVGNALCGVPRRSAVERNGTEAVPYSDSPGLEFPDVLDQLLGELWGGHPRYVKIEGTVSAEEKLAKALDIIRRARRLSGHSA